jgi:hypothetical protein
LIFQGENIGALNVYNKAVGSSETGPLIFTNNQNLGNQ